MRRQRKLRAKQLSLVCAMGPAEGHDPERGEPAALDPFPQLKDSKLSPFLKQAISFFTVGDMVSKRLSTQNYFKDQSSGCTAEILNLGAINSTPLLSYLS